MFVGIYRLFLTLFNIVYSVLIILRELWAETKRIVRTDRVESLPRDAEYVVEAVRRIDSNRLPKHLVLIIGGESPSFIDIVRVIGWCATAGIPCISFYDHDGNYRPKFSLPIVQLNSFYPSGLLRKRENEARKELAESRPELVDLVSWNSSCPVKPARNGINGIKHRMQVQLLSRTDGKREVALLAQSLGKGVIAGALKVDEIGPELLEKKLQLGGLADPDLAIVCGKICSTYGLLPWHIRTTEFLLVDRINDYFYGTIIVDYYCLITD